jgi:hypothetical protein
MKTTLAFAIAASFLTFTIARAPTIDMGKLRYDEFGRVYLDQFVFIDAWLSGYYHAKSNKTVVDLKQIAANTQKVLQFCKSNPTVTVIRQLSDRCRWRIAVPTGPGEETGNRQARSKPCRCLETASRSLRGSGK